MAPRTSAAPMLAHNFEINGIEKFTGIHDARAFPLGGKVSLVAGDQITTGFPFYGSFLITSQKLEEFFDGKAGLVDDRGKRPALEISAVERQRDTKPRLVGVLQIVM
jgi:hypothetical protein